MSNETPRASMRHLITTLLAAQRQDPEKNLPNADLFPDLLSCDEDTRTLELAYETQHWMKNPMGVVHGGVVGIMVDNVMGCAAYSQFGFPTPTISLTVNYIRPVPLGSRVVVRAHVVNAGHTMTYTSAEVFLSDQPDRVLVTATGVYSTKKA